MVSSGSNYSLSASMIVENWTMAQGRVAIALMKRLGASEMIARVYAAVYGLVNIWKVSQSQAIATPKSTDF